MKTYLQALKIVLCAVTAGVNVIAQAALPAPNHEMATITNGDFIMGDASDWEVDAPKHKVSVSAFQMDKNLIAYANWQLVCQYGITNGYSFATNAGAGSPGADHPVQTVNWYDAVKWCNARSEMEGLEPCYYTDTADSGWSAVYTSGNIGLKTNNVKWDATGYRLPTEAEWEKAARGTFVTNRFPWGMLISHSKATYTTGSTAPTYDSGPLNALPNSTTPVGQYAPNGFGLYDMAGNVDEWCWDYYSGTYYNSGASNNPTGAAPGANRVARGGRWVTFAGSCRCANRDYFLPQAANPYTGFRCVRIVQQSQIISFLLNPPYTYGDKIDLTANVTASSGGAVTFSSTGSASISSNANSGFTLNLTGLGLVTLIASQAGGMMSNGTNYAAFYATNYFNVGQKPLTIASGITANNKPYDGTNTATISPNNVALSGVILGDRANVNLSTNGYRATFASAGTNNNIAVTVSGLTLTGSAANNYTLTQPTGLAANITAATVTISSGITANDKPYDGTNTATISSNNVALSGVISGDRANVKLSTNGYTATFASASANNDIAVTVSGLTLTGSAANNYTLTQPTLTGTISQATPVVNATGGTFPYNGTAQAGSGTATGGAGENLVVTTNYAGKGSTRYGPTNSAPSAAGAYTVTASTAGDANNTAGSSSAVPLTINQATPLVNATGGTFTYNGTAQAGSGTATGGAGETLAVTLSYAGTNYGPTASAPSAAGAYTVTASTAGDANNTAGSSSAVALTINQAVLTVTHSGNSVIISWPSASTGFVLQQNSNLATTNWTTSSGISDDGTNKSITITSLTGNLFFRLSHP
jgi:formylglycine-generating enzyme required for sulfatase activity